MIFFRWCPKISFDGPIPLIFDNYLVDCIINELSNPNSIYFETYKLCYIGFRPINTLKMHERFAGENSYPFKYDHLYKIGS
jgi:cytosolic carboxypeptidase protein 2/3